MGSLAWLHSIGHPCDWWVLALPDSTGALSFLVKVTGIPFVEAAAEASGEEYKIMSKPLLLFFHDLHGTKILNYELN